MLSLAKLMGIFSSTTLPKKYFDSLPVAYNSSAKSASNKHAFFYTSLIDMLAPLQMKKKYNSQVQVYPIAVLIIIRS